MSVLLKRRVGMSLISQGGAVCRATWPSGILMLYPDSLVLGTLFKSFRLHYKDIDHVTPRLGGAEVVHHGPGVPEYGMVYGFGLCRRLKDTIQRHGLELRIQSRS